METIAIITLSLLLLTQAIERHFYSKEMNKRLSESMKAVMSRNINEFMAATAEPNKTFSKTESDEIDLSDADDELYDKHIKTIVS